MSEAVTVLRDVARAALRRTLRWDHFTVSMVATLALGLGIVAAAVSVAETVLFAPLRYEDEDALVVVWRDATRAGGADRWSVGPAAFEYLSRASSFQAMHALFGYAVNLGDDGQVAEVLAAHVTPGFLRMLGAEPMLGRSFAPNERQVVVLSHETWTSVFGADPGVIGRTVRLEDVSPVPDPTGARTAAAYVVVGVMPSDFWFPMELSSPWSRAGAWIPMVPSEVAPTENWGILTLVGRLRPTVTPEHARAELTSLSGDLVVSHPEQWTDMELRVVPLRTNHLGASRSPMGLLLLGGLLVLVIVQSNTLNLYVTRAVQRRGERRVRLALGGDRRRLSLEELLGAALLVLLSAGAGLALAATLLRLAPVVLPSTMPRAVDSSLTGIAVLTVGMLSLATALLWTAAGSLVAGRSGRLAPGSRTVGGGGRVLAASLGVQVCSVVALLASVGLTIQSARRLSAVDPGFDASARLTFMVRVPQARYPTPAQQVDLIERIHVAVELVPAVLASGSSDQIPPNRGGGGGPFMGDDPDRTVLAGLRTVSHGYLTALGLDPVRGRGFEPSDRLESQPVVVVTESLAERLWPGESAIGRTLDSAVGAAWGPKEVVGVVPDLPTLSATGEPWPEVYQAHAQDPWGQHYFVVEVDGEPRDFVARAREAVASVDEELPLARVRMHEELIDPRFSTQTFLGSVFGLFGFAALLLCGVGTVGVLSFSVARRMPEIGLRMALGASPSRILWWMGSRTPAIVGLGTVAGLGVSVLMGRRIADQLFGVGWGDAVSITASLAITAGVTLSAGVPILLRASRVEPVRALAVEE